MVPALISKLTPVYPKSAAPGDVALAEAAVSAVKQWRYRPLVVEERTVNKFVVVVTFGKNGKVK